MSGYLGMLMHHFHVHEQLLYLNSRSALHQFETSKQTRLLAPALHFLSLPAPAPSQQKHGTHLGASESAYQASQYLAATRNAPRKCSVGSEACQLEASKQGRDMIADAESHSADELLIPVYVHSSA
jgi:hypothetical protein